MTAQIILDFIRAYVPPYVTAIMLLVMTAKYYHEAKYQKWGGWNPRVCPECKRRHCVFIGDGGTYQFPCELWECPQCGKAHRYHPKQK